MIPQWWKPKDNMCQNCGHREPIKGGIFCKECIDFNKRRDENESKRKRINKINKRGNENTKGNKQSKQQFNEKNNKKSRRRDKSENKGEERK